MKPARRTPPGTRQPLYYGWIIIGVCFFIVLVCAGSRTGFGAFFNPMRQDFGWNYGLTSLAISIAMLASGFLGPLGGYLFDRLGGRKVILGGIAIMGVSTILLSLTPHILYLIFMYGIVAAIGMAGAGPSIIVALGARWFRRRRAMALGLITAGLSAGGLVMVPLAAYLTQGMGWRMAWVVLGAMILGLGFTVAFLLLRDDPRDIGLLPDGERETPQGSPDPQAAAVHTPLEAAFWSEPLRCSPTRT